ncbi:hypothetical protein DPMN_194581 [Dreissena polymorpha]|uniref:Uncharacterized protein n=1 Tax=Dreissena polymorpha TaxID=45954 RepID=A0A9D4B866_DREPO|nr:hypothetical protein DPMN_194581 [Dreissena polymorpha]
MKEKAEKKKDKKVRFVEDENEEITNSESDDDFDGEMEEFSDEDSEDHSETGDADEVEGTEDVNEDSSIENMEDDTVDDEGLFEKDQELMEGKDTDLTDVTEDIYGRLRDSEGRIVKDNKPAGGEGAYVPPAKRMKLAGGDDEKRKLKMEQLQKQLKGLVNRLVIKCLILIKRFLKQFLLMVHV